MLDSQSKPRIMLLKVSLIILELSLCKYIQSRFPTLSQFICTQMHCFCVFTKIKSGIILLSHDDLFVAFKIYSIEEVIFLVSNQGQCILKTFSKVLVIF